MVRRAVSLSIVLTVLAVLCATLGLRPRATCEEDLVQTLVSGLAEREQKLRTLQGIATIETVYDAEALAAFQKADGANGAPKDLAYKGRALHRVAFWLDFSKDRWRVEAAELISSGLNEWGFGVNYGRGEPPATTPVLVEIREGPKVTHWNLERASARIDQFDPEIHGSGGHMRPMLERYLGLRYRAAAPGGYSLGGQESLDGVECYRLVHRVEEADNRAELTLWVAPDLGFSPVRYVALSVFPNDPKRGSRSVITTSPVEVTEGIWLPAETTITTYAYVPEREQACCTTSVARFSDLKVNQSMPDSLFTLQPPLGTTVHEKGRSRVVGEIDRVLWGARRAPLAPQPDPVYLAPLQGDEIQKAP